MDGEERSGMVVKQSREERLAILENDTKAYYEELLLVKKKLAYFFQALSDLDVVFLCVVDGRPHKPISFGKLVREVYANLGEFSDQALLDDSEGKAPASEATQ